MSMEEKKLFLLDAYALIYRAYYALLRSPRMTSKGVNTSAVFGFLNTLEDLLRKENPGYIAVCFDPAHGHTFRHDEYAEYKAGRDKQPEDITFAIPYIKSMLEAFRIPVIEVQGYEADDVIGTLSRKAEAAGFTTYMMTPDKDYGQLVTDHVYMYRPSIKGQGFEVRGPRQVCERYGISQPGQVIDLLALEGDASDNVPGCPGVGEKTAAKLIQEFGSVENLLKNTDKLKGALKAKIQDNAQQILMSKHLVTIVTDAPVDFNVEKLRRKEPDTEALVAIFRELEFKSYIAKYNVAKAESVPPVQSISTGSDGMASLFDFADEQMSAAAQEAKVNINTILEHDELVKFLDKAVCSENVGIAINSAGAEAMTSRINSIGIAYLDDKGEYQTASVKADNADMVLLEPLFTNDKVCICGADIKRNMIELRRLGVEWTAASWYDVSVAHYLCQPEQNHDIRSLAMIYLGISVGESTAAGECAAIALRLKPLIEAELVERGQKKLLEEVELPLIEVLADMEWEGARIDVKELQILSLQLSERMHRLEEEAYTIAGSPFNVNSPSQVGNILFEKMQIDPKARKTKGGAWSTAEDVLEKYAKDVPLVKLILDIRALKKLLTTYVEALPKLINPATGKLHTTYRQTATATGRLSSSNPNLQNIPIRTADGRDIRRAFVPDPGCLMLSADYSQIELRLMADMSGDKEMTDAFLSGEDIHRATAAKIYKVALADVTDEQRRNAKTANFGIIYGISAFGLSERLGIPRSEAKNLIDGYLSTYARVAQYMNESIERARIDGFVSTIMGRKRYLPDINSRSNTVRSYAERNAINAPIQGSAADIIKVAMVKIFKEMKLRQLRSRMILQVHDELVFNVVPQEMASLQSLVIEGMEHAYKGRVPLEVSAGVGSNWLEAH